MLVSFGRRSLPQMVGSTLPSTVGSMIVAYSKIFSSRSQKRLFAQTTARNFSKHSLNSFSFNSNSFLQTFVFYLFYFCVGMASRYTYHFIYMRNCFLCMCLFLSLFYYNPHIEDNMSLSVCVGTGEGQSLSFMFFLLFSFSFL